MPFSARALPKLAMSCHVAEHQIALADPDLTQGLFQLKVKPRIDEDEKRQPAKTRNPLAAVPDRVDYGSSTVNKDGGQ